MQNSICFAKKQQVSFAEDLLLPYHPFLSFDVSLSRFPQQPEQPVCFERGQLYPLFTVGCVSQVKPSGYNPTHGHNVWFRDGSMNYVRPWKLRSFLELFWGERLSFSPQRSPCLTPSLPGCGQGGMWAWRRSGPGMKLTAGKQESKDKSNWALDDMVEQINHEILLATKLFH